MFHVIWSRVYLLGSEERRTFEVKETLAQRQDFIVRFARRDVPPSVGRSVGRAFGGGEGAGGVATSAVLAVAVLLNTRITSSRKNMKTRERATGHGR